MNLEIDIDLNCKGANQCMQKKFALGTHQTAILYPADKPQDIEVSEWVWVGGEKNLFLTTLSMAIVSA